MRSAKFSDRLKLRLEQLDITAAELSRRMNLSEAVVSQYKSGKYEPKQDRLEAFAKALDISEAWLMGYDTDELSETSIPNYPNVFPITQQRIPLLGSIACGEPIYKEEPWESYVLSGADVKADFCLKCKGDSMVNARILDGDIVFIRKQEQVENGEIAAVAIDDEATLKRVLYYPEKNMIILRAENSKFHDMVFTDEELNTIKILGKAVAFQSDVR